MRVIYVSLEMPSDTLRHHFGRQVNESGRGFAIKWLAKLKAVKFVACVAGGIREGASGGGGAAILGSLRNQDDDAEDNVE